MLHAKIYIFDDQKAIITSANLTLSGFKRNIEYGVLINDPEMVRKIVVDFQSICNGDGVWVVNSKSISGVKGILNNLPPFYRSDGEALDFTGESNDILHVDDKGLITKGLNNWRKTVFVVVDSLGTCEFSLSDIYKKESLFSAKFPNNHTIRESIRRNLQDLRDLGLIEFLGGGRYRRLWE